MGGEQFCVTVFCLIPIWSFHPDCGSQTAVITTQRWGKPTLGEIRLLPWAAQDSRAGLSAHSSMGHAA